MIEQLFKKFIARPVGFLGRLSDAVGIPAWSLTLAAFIAGVEAALAFYLQFPLVGAILYLASGFFDMLDGATARAAGETSRFGAFIDWVGDKYVDALVLGAMGITYLHPVLAILLVTGSLLATFSKTIFYTEVESPARIDGRVSGSIEAVGVFGRTETIVTTVAAAALYAYRYDDALLIGAIITVVGVHFTLVERIIHAAIVARRTSEDPARQHRDE